MSTFHGVPILAPVLLPFNIVSYDGENESSLEYPINNVLLPSRDRFHCSKKGANFDLILNYTPDSYDPSVLTQPATHQSISQLPECMLTHVVIRAPSSCSAPLRTGIMFAHSINDLVPHLQRSQSISQLIEARVASYTERYNSISRAQYETRDLAQITNDGVITHFTIDNRDSLEIALSLPTWTKAAFVHVKLIDSDRNIDENIDIERIALVGFQEINESVNQPIIQVPLDLPTSLQLTRRQLSQSLNAFHPDFMQTIINQPCCLLICDDPMKVQSTIARTLIDSLAQSGQYSSELNFFYYDRSVNESGNLLTNQAASQLLHESPLEELMISLADHLGVIESGSKDLPKEPTLVIAFIARGLKFIYNGQFDNDLLTDWFDAFVDGSLEPHRKSQPRLVDDLDPDHAGITVVVADNFDEIVLEDTIKDCVVHLSEAWTGSQLTLSIIWHIAALLKQHYPRLVDQFLTIGTLDIVNDVRAELFDENELPIIKFFPALSKTDPETFIAYEGPARCGSLLSFIHRHLTCRPHDKFDLQQLIALCAPIDAELEEREEKLKKFAELTKLLEECEFQLSADENDTAYDVALRLKPLVEAANDLTTLASTRRAFAALIAEFEQCLKPLEELNDACRLAKMSTSLAAELVFMSGNALSTQERHMIDHKIRALLDHIPNRSDTDAVVPFYPVDDRFTPPEHALGKGEIDAIRRQAADLFALQDSFRPRVAAWRQQNEKKEAARRPS